jgi:hypothetical protein
MQMMKWVTESGLNCVEWVDDGQAFIINNPTEFTDNVVNRFFKATKFSSFTRKLYRWGFRQLNRGVASDDPIIFGNDYFQRDCEELMTRMKSVTAASARKVSSAPSAIIQHSMIGMKHSLEEADHDENLKRMFLMNQLQQHKADTMNTTQNQSMYDMMNLHNQLSLSNALRPAQFGGFQGNQQGMMQMQYYNQQGMAQAPNNTNVDDDPQHFLPQMLQLGPETMQTHSQEAFMAMANFQQPQHQVLLQMQQQPQQQRHMIMQHQPYPQQIFQQPTETYTHLQHGVGNVNMADYIPQQTYPHPASTAEIVNAAISALRFPN